MYKPRCVEPLLIVSQIDRRRGDPFKSRGQAHGSGQADGPCPYSGDSRRFRSPPLIAGEAKRGRADMLTLASGVHPPF